MIAVNRHFSVRVRETPHLWVCMDRVRSLSATARWTRKSSTCVGRVCMRLNGWCPQSTAKRLSWTLLLCGLLSLSVYTAASRAAIALTVLSNDPYTNTTSFHQAEVE